MAQVSRKHVPISCGPIPTCACSPNYEPPQEPQSASERARDRPDLRHTLCSERPVRSWASRDNKGAPDSCKDPAKAMEEVLGQPLPLSCGETEARGGSKGNPLTYVFFQVITEDLLCAG